MQVALEVSYQNIDDAQALGEAIRAHVDYLKESHEKLAACRVKVARRAANDNGNNARSPAVLIELDIPGERNIVVSHEPASRSGASVGDTIQEAFEKAERALHELRKIREINMRIAAEGGDLSFLGQVSEIYPLEDYGYLLNKDGERLYFHRDAIVEGDFDYLVCGAVAYYEEEENESGRLASKLWVRELD